MLLGDDTVGISMEFCFRWQKKSWEGEGDKGGKGGEKKNCGKKLKEKKKGGGEGNIWREGESNSRRALISLKPYPSPTVNLKLHCEQF